jgi:hypothetical protein
MKEVCKYLNIICLCLLAMAIALVLLFETDILPVGLMTYDKQSEFVLTFIMELLSLGAAFLGLRLFRFKTVHDDLIARTDVALFKWGSIRLFILEVPMVLDTLLYYFYMNTTFGYLGIMLLLCLPFVYPTLSRCEAEVCE